MGTGHRTRHFTWVIKDKVAVCERPGHGYGVNHRKVRRQEEIIWLRQNEFDFVMSLCGSSQNLHNYEEMGLPFHHVPFSGPAAGPLSLTRAMASIRDHVQAGDKIIIHREMLGERITGLVAAYLVWMELVPDGPQAISITERLFERELGQVARELVAMVERCEPSSAVPVDAFAHTADDEIDDGGIAEPDDD